MTIFAVAVFDWLSGAPFAPLTLVGGIFIVSAFIVLSWASWQEIREAQEDELAVD